MVFCIRKRRERGPTAARSQNHVGLAVAVAERAREPSLLDMLGLRDAAAKGHFLATLTDRLAAEIAAAGCHTLLLSNEHLSSRVKTAEEVAALRRLVEKEAAGRASSGRSCCITAGRTR